MPPTEVLIYSEMTGESPVLDWIRGQRRGIQEKYDAYIGMLASLGYELRRPTADMLRDGIRELRVTRGRGPHHRMLYHLFGDCRAILLHGCVKEGEVDERDIEIAVERLRRFKRNPDAHTYEEEGDEHGA